MTLVEMLVNNGVVSQAQADEAVALQKEKGGLVGQTLIELGLIKQDDLVSFLVKNCRIPYLSLLDYQIGKDILALVPAALCLKYHLLPIDRLGRILTVAMVDPLDDQALEDLRAACPNMRIKPILCTLDHFNTVSGAIFGKGGHGGDMPGYDIDSLGLAHVQPKARKGAPATRASKSKSKEEEEEPLDDGLSDVLASAVDAAVKDAAATQSAVKQAPGPDEVPAPATAPVLPPQPSGLELAAMIRDGVSGAMRDAMVTIAGQMREATATAERAPQLTAQELGKLVNDGVGAAVTEAMAAMVAQMREVMSERGPEPAPAAGELATVVRDGVSSAIRETMAPMLEQMRTAQGEQPPQASADRELATMVRDGVGSAIQETMAPMLEQMRPVQEEQPPEASVTGGLTDALREGIRQALQETEAAAVAQGNLEELHGLASGRVRRARQSPILRLGMAEDASGEDSEEQAEDDDRVLAALFSDNLLEGLTFDTFVVGKSNEFTCKLCLAVAEKPGKEYNPFFLFGGVGLGKTHLISAIGNAILKTSPGCRIGYISSSHFVTRLAAAASAGNLDAFREHYCHWDILILDDIQFLGGKVEAQEEFFHIFNVLLQQHRQIIIASDKPPDRLGLLEQRLVSRFASGIVSSINPPEWATRMAILRREAEQNGAEPNEEALALIATRVPGDIRKMVGSLRKVLAYAELTGESLSHEMTEQILSHLGIGEAA